MAFFLLEEVFLSHITLKHIVITLVQFPYTALDPLKNP